MGSAPEIPQDKNGENHSAPGKFVKGAIILCVLLIIVIIVIIIVAVSTDKVPAHLASSTGVIWFVVVLLLAPIVFALILVLAHALQEFRKKMDRIQSFRESASRLGMSYSRRGLVKKVSHPRDVRAKDKRNVVLNLFKGMSEGRRVHAFEMAEYKDPDYEPLYSCFTLEHDGDFPLLVIEPRENRSKREVKKLLRIRGIQEINFEGYPMSAAFSQAFRVISTDEEFARAICHEEMARCLLDCTDCALNILGNGITLTRWKTLQPENVESGLRRLAEICTSIPTDLLPAEIMRDSFLNVASGKSPGDTIETARQTDASPQTSPKDSVLLNCTACGKEVFASMAVCPYCNKPTTPPLRDGIRIVGQTNPILRAQLFASAGVMGLGIILFSKGVGKWDTETGAHAYAPIPGFVITLAGLIWHLATRRLVRQNQR